MNDVYESVRFQQESPSAFKRGGCPLSAGIRVRFQQELLSAFRRNPCPLSARMSVRFAREYAHNAMIELSKLNSGATRSHHLLRKAPPRGPNTFVEFDKYDGIISKIAEVTIPEVCNLPAEIQTSDSPEGEWKNYSLTE